MGTPCASAYIAAAPTSYEVRIRRAHIATVADFEIADKKHLHRGPNSTASAFSASLIWSKTQLSVMCQFVQPCSTMALFQSGDLCALRCSKHGHEGKVSILVYIWHVQSCKVPLLVQCHAGWSGSSLVGEEHWFRWPEKGRSPNFREQTS